MRHFFNGILKTIIIGMVIVSTTIITTFCLCYFGYNYYLKPIIKAEISKQIVQNKTALPQVDIIDRTEAYYDKKFQQLLFIFGTVFTLFGLGIPILTTFFQHMSLKEDKEDINSALNKAKEFDNTKYKLENHITGMVDIMTDSLMLTVNSTRDIETRLLGIAKLIILFLSDFSSSTTESEKNLKGSISHLTKDIDEVKPTNQLIKSNFSDMLASLKNIRKECTKKCPNLLPDFDNSIFKFDKLLREHSNWKQENPS